MPPEVRGSSLVPLLAHDAQQRDIGIFGMFGGPIGATDGRYTYYLYPEDLYAPGLYEYTLMPMHLHTLFSGAEMTTTAKLTPPFDFTKDMPMLRIDALKDARRIPMQDGKKFDPGVGTTLYDLATDPQAEAAVPRRGHRAALSRRHRAACCARTTRRPSSIARYGVRGAERCARSQRQHMPRSWRTGGER